MNRINEIGDTPRGQKVLGAVFARAHNRKNWCDKNMVEPYRKDSKDYWQNVEHNASSEVGRNAKDKLKGFENFGAGAQEYYKNHLPNDTIQIPQHESKNGNMNKKLIRLTESDLHRIVKESVNKVLNEIGDTPKGQYMLGRVAGRGRERAADYARANGVTGEQTPFRVGKIKKHDNIANDALKTSAKAKGQSIDNGNLLWMHDDNFAKGFYGQEDAESAIYDPTLTSYYERGNIEALSDEDLIDSYYGAAYGGTPIDLDLLYREIKARGLGKALKQDPRYHKYH